MNLTPKQNEVVQAIREDYRYILTGGAISTAKSYGIAFILLSMAYQFPKTRYAIARLNRTTLKRTIYLTAKEVAEKAGIDYRENMSELSWTFHNGSQIFFIELDHTKDRDYNKLKGLELTAGAIDECNEVQEEAFNVFSSRIGRKNENNEPQFLLLTCNPSNTWVKERFYTPHVSGTLEKPYIFIPSLPSDNPYNNSAYIESLMSMPIGFKKRYVEGNWDYSDDEKALFKYRHFDSALTTALDTGELRYIGYDVARSGTDRSVVSLWYGSTLVDIQILKDKQEQKTTDEQALMLIKYAHENQVENIRVHVDGVGVGVGVIDHLKSKGIKVSEYIAGAKASSDKYQNKRTESYYTFSQGLEKGKIKIYQGCPFRNEMIAEAMAHNYEISDTKIILESKDKVKQRTGGISPDIIDAVVFPVCDILGSDRKPIRMLF